MKTTDPRDPLDKKIDQLLAGQPAKGPTNFAARIIAEIEAEPPLKKPGPLAPLIRFALPLAAALALAFLAFNQYKAGRSEAPAQNNGLATIDSEPNHGLSSYEIQELLILQEGLSGFAQIESEDLDNSSDLLDTLEILYSI